MTATAKTHQDRRRRLRKQLEEEGLPADEIEQRVEELKRAHAAQRAADPPSKPANNRGDKDSEQRRRLRRRLEAEGASPALIERRVAAVAARQRAARVAELPEPGADAPLEARLKAAARRAAVPPERFDDHVDAWHEAHRPDDSGYKPTTPDPLARGAARVTPATLRAAKRAKATTKYEHNQENASG